MLALFLDEAMESSEDDVGVGQTSQIGEDRELKDKLFHRYSGCVSSLMNEFLKRKKKGKLPREAKQILHDWWTTHFKWPYPTVEYLANMSLVFDIFELHPIYNFSFLLVSCF